ncbi:MAG: DUF302 domain-containing protein [Candidatus Sericytochromatia bacterium]|nr:DUF302 domain-containing protein [Candidatus Sericytochromatia bacterium]
MSTLQREFDLSMDEILTRLPEALKAEGFGILTEIDVAATLKAKLDVDFRPYRILGACNPEFAHRALGQDLGMGTVMPCNVVVWQDGAKTVVRVVDPVATVGAACGDALCDLAGEARTKLEAALARIG